MDASDTKARDLIDQTVHSTDRSTESNNCDVSDKKRRGKYAMINNEKRRELIKLVLEKGSSIHRAAQAVGINTSTAKGIIQIYKREGRVNKKKTREMSKTIVYNLIMPEMKAGHASTQGQVPVMMNTTVLPSFPFGNSNNFFPGTGVLPPFQATQQVQVPQSVQTVQLPSQFQPLPTLPHPQQINLFGQQHHQNVHHQPAQPSQMSQQMGAFALNPNAAAQLLLSQYGQQGAFGGAHNQYDRATTMLLMNMLNNQNHISSLRNSQCNSNPWIKAAEF